MSEKYTISERVDLLLTYGVDKPKKWTKVHGYLDPIPPVESNDSRAKDEWQRLRDHHLEETNFLFQIIEELCSRLKNK